MSFKPYYRVLGIVSLKLISSWKEKRDSKICDKSHAINSNPLPKMVQGFNSN